jgi:peptide deformylase
MKLIKNKEKLSKPLQPQKLSQQEIDEISTTLLKELRKHKGIGLSANQIGLNVRACAINVKEPLVFINPRIVEMDEEQVVYVEQCLSIPKTMKKPVKTVRRKEITIECDNLGTVVFSPDSDNWDSSNDFWNDMGMLETVVIQHELDHLDGILITDKTRRYNETVRTNKVSRNQRVMVKLDDGSTDFVKYKHVVNGDGSLRSPYVEIL